jgi:von Willebrand factor type A domain
VLRSSDTLGVSWLGCLAWSALAWTVTACGESPDHAPPLAPVEEQPTNRVEVGPGPGDDVACVGTKVETRRLAVDVFAVLDGSGSMRDATESGVSKWYATKAAFREFLSRAPADMGVGLSFFPLPGEDAPSCSAARYRAAALPIKDVSDMATGALAELDRVTPGGQTPTAPALTAALELASAHAASHSDRSVVVVLATDGLPTTCEPTDSASLAALAAEALDGPAHVRTLVVSSSSLKREDDETFRLIAAAGGTERPVLIDPSRDFSKQLGDALDATAARAIACDLALPEPPPGKHLDYDAVNVVLEDDQRTVLRRVSGPHACTSSGGWYYDVDPSQGAPSRLAMCKASCERTRAASLTVELGCRTTVR